MKAHNIQNKDIDIEKIAYDILVFCSNISSNLRRDGFADALEDYQDIARKTVHLFGLDTIETRDMDNLDLWIDNERDNTLINGTSLIRTLSYLSKKNILDVKDVIKRNMHEGIENLSLKVELLRTQEKKHVWQPLLLTINEMKKLPDLETWNNPLPLVIVPDSQEAYLRYMELFISTQNAYNIYLFAFSSLHKEGISSLITTTEEMYKHRANKYMAHIVLPPADKKTFHELMDSPDQIMKTLIKISGIKYRIRQKKHDKSFSYSPERNKLIKHTAEFAKLKAKSSEVQYRQSFNGLRKLKEYYKSIPDSLLHIPFRGIANAINSTVNTAVECIDIALAVEEPHTLANRINKQTNKDEPANKKAKVLNFYNEVEKLRLLRSSNQHEK